MQLLQLFTQVVRKTDSCLGTEVATYSVLWSVHDCVVFLFQSVEWLLSKAGGGASTTAIKAFSAGAPIWVHASCYRASCSFVGHWTFILSNAGLRQRNVTSSRNLPNPASHQFSFCRHKTVSKGLPTLHCRPSLNSHLCFHLRSFVEQLFSITIQPFFAQKQTGTK